MIAEPNKAMSDRNVIIGELNNAALQTNAMLRKVQELTRALVELNKTKDAHAEL